MFRRRMMTAAAVAAVVTMGLTACNSKAANNNKNNKTTKGGFNAAVGHVLRPSDQKGGTLRFANSGDWDSLDPADTYYGYSWDFIRNYGRSLTSFAAKPGKAGTDLVGDLAEGLGKPSDNAKTWTYKLRKGVKYEDGTPVTSKDVKYAVERSLDKDTFPNGPTYFNDFLDLQGYTSPYKDPDPNKLGLKAIDTPDDQTIVFHLIKPFSAFDYFVMMPATIPVPRAKDTGTKYKEHVVSTGPYMFETNQIGKQFTLVRNKYYDPSTDPDTGRKPLADRIVVQLNVNADDIDNRLLADDLDIDITGTGLQPASQGKVLTNPTLKAKADSAGQARLWFTVINPDVAPLNNIHCRKAVLYGADKTGYQRAYGGSVGGEIATNLLPPLIPGAKQFDLYEFKSKPDGDTAKAKQELQACGQPGGFSTNISYRAERPKEKATAEALQASLAKVGIKLTIRPYPQGDYTKLYAGKPDYAKSNRLGLMIYGWGADWPDGFGFLQQIVDSRVIRAVGGNTNLGIKIPEVDRLIDKALQTTSKEDREKIWPEIDRKVMENANVLPGVWSKTLLFRPDTLTNVFVNDGLGGFYDYAAIGTKKG